MTGAPSDVRYTLSVRILHWLVAALVFTMLIVGFALANALADYATLLMLHKTLGALIFVVMIVRVVNRLRHHAPPLPATVSVWERRAVAGSEVSLYAALLAQPVVGWAMLTAAGLPVVIGGVRLPSIVPVDAGLYALLRNGHSVLAYTLVILVAGHVSAVLLHTLTLRDGMLGRMMFRTPSRSRAEATMHSKLSGDT
ncbi:MAG TPA: cytochrome b [Mycobacterium sp.]|nr:cytochrome b [Mycobacterium sp.]